MEGVVRIQSALYEGACEKNSRGLKFFAIQIYRINISAFEKVVSRIANSCVGRITKKCCLQKGSKNNEWVVIAVIIVVYMW